MFRFGFPIVMLVAMHFFPNSVFGAAFQAAPTIVNNARKKVSLFVSYPHSHENSEIAGNIPVANKYSTAGIVAINKIAGGKLSGDADKVHNQPTVTSLGSPSLATWKRRLITKEDAMNFHKFAAAGFTLSSILILIAGALHGFTETPEYLNPPTYVFVASTFVQSVTSVHMALNFRKNSEADKRGFVTSAIGCFFLCFLGWWASPLAPDFFNHSKMVDTFIFLLALGCFVGALDELFSSSDVLSARRAKNQIDGVVSVGYEATQQGLPINEILSYFALLVAPGTIQTSSTMWRLGHVENTPRLDFVQACREGIFLLEGAEQQALFYYAMVASALLLAMVILLSRFGIKN